MSVNNQAKFAWLIFLPPALIFFGISHALFFLNFSFFKLIFFFAAGVSIYIYARQAFEIHTQGLVTNKDQPEKNKWHLYNQYWLNGLGAFVGWVMFYYLLFYKIRIDNPEQFVQLFDKKIELLDLALGLIAFFGITGYFPYAAVIGRLKP